jgi:hypothetical protein
MRLTMPALPGGAGPRVAKPGRASRAHAVNATSRQAALDFLVDAVREIAELKNVRLDLTRGSLLPEACLELWCV